MTDLYVEQSYYIYEPSETVYTGIIYYIINFLTLFCLFILYMGKNIDLDELIIHEEDKYYKKKT